MNMPAHRGFTIIEVMLFLAISGVMAALLLGGWTLMINTQRYKDSTDTVYGYIQDQYNLVYNVENERSSSLTCTSGGQIVNGTGDSRGQSDCVLMGRFIKLTNGTTFRSYAVVGREPSAGAAGSDTDIIKSYNPAVVGQSIGLSEVEQVVPWGAVIEGQAGNTDPLNLNIMLLRSPESGIVHRYITNGSSQVDPIIDLSEIKSDNENDDVMLCFDPGVMVQGGKQAVVIRKYASSRNSVETLGSDNGC